MLNLLYVRTVQCTHVLHVHNDNPYSWRFLSSQLATLRFQSQHDTQLVCYMLHQVTAQRKVFYTVWICGGSIDFSSYRWFRRGCLQCRLLDEALEIGADGAILCCWAAKSREWLENWEMCNSLQFYSHMGYGGILCNICIQLYIYI